MRLSSKQCGRITRLLWLSLAANLILSLSNEVCAAGKYVLAYWREIGCYENGSRHNVFVHVFDENGNPKANVTIKSPSGTVYGTTNTEGWLDLPIYTGGGYYMLCDDGTGATSDVTPYMTTRRWPNWGHYSYECAFLYKSSANNPGTFDTSLIGTLNMDDSHETDAPCTRSLAYYNLNPLDWYSDDGMSYSSSGTVFGQTFRANGNRVIACKIQGTTGGTYQYTASIHEGGPSGPQVGIARTIYTIWSGEYNKTLLAWPVNGVPVTPGQTYYLKVVRTGGGLWQVYRGPNNYSDGNFFKDGSPVTNDDIFGLVVCGNFGDPIVISNLQVRDVTATSARITWTTNYASTSRVDYGPTTSYGQYVYDSALVTNHTVSLTGLLPETTYHFKVTSTADGKLDGVSGDSTFATTALPPANISVVKLEPDGTMVTIRGKTVTAGNDQLSSTFYVEDEDRSGGIRVYSSTPTVKLGDAVDVTGTITTSNGERLISNPNITIKTASYPVPLPHCMLTREVGGSALNDNTPGVTGGVGTHNTGLLIQIWGRVTAVEADTKTFYIDDGCGITDVQGHVGLPVTCGGLAVGNTIAMPSPNSFVKVIGISARKQSGGKIIPVLRPRSQADIVVYQ